MSPADMITQLMFNLVRHPEHIQPRHEEIIALLGEDGFFQPSLDSPKFLDSIFKVSQRLRPINDSKKA